jgi:hypothetical protein
MVGKQTPEVTEASVERTESQQSKLTAYNMRAGRPLLYALPLLLVALTIISRLNIVQPTILLVVLIAVLAMFAINTFILGLLASKTKSAFTKRLELERHKGRPLDSLQGFVAIRSGVDRTISTIRSVFLLGLIVLILYVGYVWLVLTQLSEELSTWVAFLGLGLSLVCFGASLLVRSVRMDITSVTGLSDFYRPTSHELFLDNFFADVFRGHLDPIARLKWDEFTEAVRLCLKPSFVESILKNEANESPVAFAVEKLLYLHYMEHSGVLSHQKFLDELGEFLDLQTERYHPDRGTRIGGRYYFNAVDIYRVFHLIESTTPAVFDLIDRLQLELMDNISIISSDPVYLDASAQEVCLKDSECHFLLLLYNNSKDAKDFAVRITVSGLEPSELRVKISAEGRGSFAIPSEPIPLVSDSDKDVAHVLATILKNSVSLWLTLEPREIGVQTLQVFVEDDQGRVIEGKTMPVAIIRNITYQLKRLTSVSSIAGGAIAPLFHALSLA